MSAKLLVDNVHAEKLGKDKYWNYKSRGDQIVYTAKSGWNSLSQTT